MTIACAVTDCTDPATRPALRDGERIHVCGRHARLFRSAGSNHGENLGGAAYADRGDGIETDGGRDHPDAASGVAEPDPRTDEEVRRDGGTITAREAQDPLDYAALTAFQRDIIAILAAGDRYGLALKEDLEALYDEPVNHGRLYPNLDDLAADGWVAKYELDKRTNGYRLTDRARSALQDHLAWAREQLHGGDGA